MKLKAPVALAFVSLTFSAFALADCDELIQQKKTYQKQIRDLNAVIVKTPRTSISYIAYIEQLEGERDTLQELIADLDDEINMDPSCDEVETAEVDLPFDEMPLNPEFDSEYIQKKKSGKDHYHHRLQKKLSLLENQRRYAKKPHRKIHLNQAIQRLTEKMESL